MTERERTYDEAEEVSEDEYCGECEELLDQCTCGFCDDCGEELNQWDRCPNRCHLSESEKRSEDLDTIGCEQYHAEREERDWDDD